MHIKSLFYSLTTVLDKLTRKTPRRIEVTTYINDDRARYRRNEEAEVPRTEAAKKCCSTAKQAHQKHWTWIFYPHLDTFKIPMDFCPAQLCPSKSPSTAIPLPYPQKDYPFNNLLIHKTDMSLETHSMHILPL